VTGRARSRTAPGPGHRRSRSPTGSICGRTSPRPSRSASPQWIADASDAGLPGISSFAKGLKQDLDAVTNSVTMPWSSGLVEGLVNHIKMIKRQMFRRAGLPLLRKRVLLTARS